MINDKLLNFIGICKKSGSLNMGCDAVSDTIKKRKAFLVLIAADTSEKTRDNIKKLAVDFSVDLMQINETIDDIYMVLGKRVAVISVTDKNLANKLKDLQRN